MTGKKNPEERGSQVFVFQESMFLQVVWWPTNYNVVQWCWKSDNHNNLLMKLKQSALPVRVPCPDIIKMRNQGMSGVDLVDHTKSRCNLHCKSSIRFYLNTLFFLMNIVYTIRFIVFKMMDPNDVTILDFKTIVSTYLTGRYTNRWKSHQRIKSHQNYWYQCEMNNLPTYLWHH